MNVTIRDVAEAAGVSTATVSNVLNNTGKVGRSTHRLVLSTVRKLADEIIVLDRDGIAERGSHAELLALDGWYAEMARLQDAGGGSLSPAGHELEFVS